MMPNNYFDDDDLVVVPMISLNPKKAQKKLKKANAAKEAEVAPVAAAATKSKKNQQQRTQPQKAQQQQQQQLAKPQRQPCEQKEAWRRELLEEMSTSASEGEDTASSSPGQSPPIRSSPVSGPQQQQRQLSFSEMMAAERTWSSRSWFDVTEEDDDEFIMPLKDVAGRSLVPMATESSPVKTLGIISATTSSVSSAPTSVVQTSAFLAQMANSLEASVLANVFLCLELKHVGSFACVCKQAKAAVWEDVPFWHALGGPVFAREVGQDVLRLARPAVLRDRFRVWVYGLEGDWAGAFETMADKKHHVDVFVEASYMLAGLEASDGAEEIDVFCRTVTEQLHLLDAADDRAKDVAFQFMSTAVRREKLIGAEVVGAMREALEDSVERALVLQAETRLESFEGLSEVGPFELAEHLAAEEQQQLLLKKKKELVVPGGAEEEDDSEKFADGCLSLAFLAALGNRHESMDVRGAQEAVATRVLSRA